MYSDSNYSATFILHWSGYNEHTNNEQEITTKIQTIFVFSFA